MRLVKSAAIAQRVDALAAARALWESLEDQAQAALEAGEGLELVELTADEHRLLWLYNDELHRTDRPGITPETHFETTFRVIATPTLCPRCDKPSSYQKCADAFHQPQE